MQALVQLSRRPLFNMDQVTFKPFVKFDIKARVSREVAAGVVLTDEVRDPDHLPYVKVLHIARGSRFDGCLKVGDFLQTINGVSIRVRSNNGATHFTKAVSNHQRWQLHLLMRIVLNFYL